VRSYLLDRGGRWPRPLGLERVAIREGHRVGSDRVVTVAKKVGGRSAGPPATLLTDDGRGCGRQRQRDYFEYYWQPPRPSAGRGPHATHCRMITARRIRAADACGRSSWRRTRAVPRQVVTIRRPHPGASHPRPDSASLEPMQAGSEGIVVCATAMPPAVRGRADDVWLSPKLPAAATHRNAQSGDICDRRADRRLRLNRALRVTY